MNENVLDVFLFGSFVKGKYKPSDIDICLVFRKNLDMKLVDEIKKALKGFSLHVSMLTADNFFQKFHSLVPTVFFEGISIIDDKFVSEKYNAKQMFLYKYDVSLMSQSRKTQFVRLLRGKNNLVQKLKGEFIAPGVFLLPLENEGKILEFLEYWRVNYEKKKILLMS